VGTLSPQTHELKRKEQHMFKHILRMILPLVVVVLIAACLVLSPVLATHAAAPPGVEIHTLSSQLAHPDRFWRP
jgi:hypothetical protein